MGGERPDDGEGKQDAARPSKPSGGGTGGKSEGGSEGVKDPSGGGGGESTSGSGGMPAAGGTIATGGSPAGGARGGTGGTGALPLDWSIPPTRDGDHYPDPVIVEVEEDAVTNADCAIEYRAEEDGPVVRRWGYDYSEEDRLVRMVEEGLVGGVRSYTRVLVYADDGFPLASCAGTVCETYAAPKAWSSFPSWEAQGRCSDSVVSAGAIGQRILYWGTKGGGIRCTIDGCHEVPVEVVVVDEGQVGYDSSGGMLTRETVGTNGADLYVCFDDGRVVGQGRIAARELGFFEATFHTSGSLATMHRHRQLSEHSFTVEDVTCNVDGWVTSHELEDSGFSSTTYWNQQVEYQGDSVRPSGESVLVGTWDDGLIYWEYALLETDMSWTGGALSVDPTEGSVPYYEEVLPSGVAPVPLSLDPLSVPAWTLRWVHEESTGTAVERDEKGNVLSVTAAMDAAKHHPDLVRIDTQPGFFSYLGEGACREGTNPHLSPDVRTTDFSVPQTCDYQLLLER